MAGVKTLALGLVLLGSFQSVVLGSSLSGSSFYYTGAYLNMSDGGFARAGGGRRAAAVRAFGQVEQIGFRRHSKIQTAVGHGPWALGFSQQVVATAGPRSRPLHEPARPIGYRRRRRCERVGENLWVLAWQGPRPTAQGPSG